MIFFDDLSDGTTLDCQPVHFTRESIVEFAVSYDPQPFHVDEKLARNSVFGGLVASALHVLSACTRVVVEAQGQTAIMSGLGIEQVNIFNPVRPGDTLLVKAIWSDLKRSRSKPDRGVAVLRCNVSNQKNETVMEYGYRYLIARRRPDKSLEG